MEENTQLELEFPSVCGNKIFVDFEGGVVTSDVGLLLLRETERSAGIIRRLVKYIPDNRDQRYDDRTMGELMTHHIMQIACGYEDADDSDSLRSDPALKIAWRRTPLSSDDLGSQPTMSRLENTVSHTTLFRMG